MYIYILKSLKKKKNIYIYFLYNINILYTIYILIQNLLINKINNNNKDLQKKK